MMPRLRRAVVLGAGVMGSAIAAHLANAGVPVLLLDIVPSALSDVERRRDLSLNHPDVRNRLAATGKDRALASQPAAFFTPQRAQLVDIGNIDDHLQRIADADWVIEAVVEDLQIKQELLARVEAHWKSGLIVSTNTSGLPVHQLVHDRSMSFRQHFLGTHFFNPPRYMKLLEIIPLAETDSEIVATVSQWGDRLLGKGIVYAHDRPNFIANRIGSYGFRKAVQMMLELGLSIEEVDELTGPVLGRPRSATFRTTDLVGLDTVIHVSENAYRFLPDDDERDIFIPPPLFQEMHKRGWLGEKTGSGFYKRVDGEIYALDYTKMEYRPRRKVALPTAETAKLIDDPAKRLRTLTADSSPASQFVWRLLSSVLVYAAKRIPEITDDIVNVDRALRWGYAWDHGPFETWDLLGVTDTVKRLQAENHALPPLVHAVAERGNRAFYQLADGRREYFDLATTAYRPIEEPVGILVLPAIKSADRVVATNTGASLIDLGDGIACLEFHSKLNTLGEDAIRMLHRSLEELSRRFDGLVIGNQGKEFSAGANLMLLLMEAQDGNWDEIDGVLRQFQRANLALRYSARPVVAAPFGRALGGGCEICLVCARIQAAAELYMGLVETGVGLIPAGGGVTEVVRRAVSRLPGGVDADLFPLVRWAFETIATGKVSTSAEEARALGYLRDGDGISINGDRVIGDAKAVCLSLVRTGYRPPVPEPIRVVGTRGVSAIDAYLFLMQTAGHISEYDAHIGKQLAAVVCGGSVPYGSQVSEEYLHGLEREAFFSLLGQPKTQDRIRHFLQTGRPLRN